MRANPTIRRPAAVLISVLVVVVLLSLAAYKYSEMMTGEYRAATAGARAIQARAIAESGISYAASILALAGSPEGDPLGGNLWDNAPMFSGIPVPNDNPRDVGQFHIVSLSTPDDSSRPYRPGITDECGKINLNALLALDNGKGDKALAILSTLPGLVENPAVAAAIVDWIDTDSTPRQGGAENETYGTMDPPYQCKNGPLDSLEELLLVQGMTPELLFGGDRNRNGTLDPDEGGGGEVAGQGLSAFLTVYSREVNVASTGLQRVNINNADLAALKDALGAANISTDAIQYILAYRLYGGSTVSSGSSSSGSTDTSAVASQIDADLAKGGKNKIASLWDLTNSQVTVSTGSGRSAKSVVVPSPFLNIERQRSDLPAVFDNCALNEQKEMTPRINVMSAPSAVLMALTQVAGLAETDLAAIQDKRPALTDPSVGELLYKTPVWLLTEAGLKVDMLKKLDKYISSRSQVYRFQVLGLFDKGGPSARVEAVVDTNQGRPRILYWRDLSELGRGFDIRPEAAK